VRVALVAGEASGDLLGAGLVQALSRQVAELSCEGVAGSAMREAGVEAVEDADALAVMGLVEPLVHLPRLICLRRELARRWLASPPDVFVGIDAPDFNLGLERRLKAAGVPTVHYVSPTVWAWRQGRVRTIARATDRVLCLMPFEKRFYDRHGVAATFVGHPLADRLPANPDRDAARARLGIAGRPVVTVMPGSRLSEVSRLGPVFLGAAEELARRYPEAGFVTPFAGRATRELFESQLAASGLGDRFTLIDRDSESAIIAADVVLLASGTAALEAALLERPTVAAYRLAAPTYWLARLFSLVKVRHFTLPNQLTAEPLVPEFVQGAATPAALADAVAGLLDDPGRRRSIEATFASLRAELARGANEQAAKAVIEAAGCDAAGTGP